MQDESHLSKGQATFAQPVTQASETSVPVSIALLFPHFQPGGAESVGLKVLQKLDRTRFRPTLILQSATGELLERVPADVSVVDLGGKRAFRAVLAVARVFEAHRFDVVHTFTNAASILCQSARLVARHKPATILSEHTPLNLFIDDSKLPMLRSTLMRITFPSAARIAAPIGAICEEHKELLGPRCPPSVVLPNPVLQKPVAAIAPQQPPVARRIVTLSRLSPEKRPDLLVHAFAEAFADDSAATLTIHGEGVMRAELANLVKELNLTERVFLPGFTNDVATALAEADMFVCTSEREGFGNAIVEAMAAGVPVLSVDCPFGPRFLLNDGQAGYLASDDGVSELAQAMHAFAHDVFARKRMSAKARQIVAAYDIDAAIAAHETLYNEVASGL